MRSVVVGALALVLAACSGAQSTSGDTGSAAAADDGGSEKGGSEKGGSEKGDTAKGSASDKDNPFAPGTYKIEVADGPEGGVSETINLVLNADESFEISEGANKEGGVFVIEKAASGSKACFKEAKDSEQNIICMTAGPRKEDGSWTVTNDGGEPATLTRVKE